MKISYIWTGEERFFFGVYNREIFPKENSIVQNVTQNIRLYSRLSWPQSAFHST